MNRPERYETHAEKDNLLMSGALSNGAGGEGMKYAARLRALSKDGTVTYSGNSIRVQDAGDVMLILTASTDYSQDYPDFIGGDPLATSLEQLNLASSKSSSELKKRHTADFNSLFSRMRLKLASVNLIPFLLTEG
jgi:alpha-L-fucosidase 2